MEFKTVVKKKMEMRQKEIRKVEGKEQYTAG